MKYKLKVPLNSFEVEKICFLLKIVEFKVLLFMQIIFDYFEQ